MKNLIIALVLCINTSVFALDFLSDSQRSTVLREIDNICGDSWCEGDYNYSFDKFSCDSVKQTCILELRLFDGYSEEDENTVYHSGVCALEGLSDYSQMIEKSGKWDTLTWSFYEQVSDCINSLEIEEMNK